MDILRDLTQAFIEMLKHIPPPIAIAILFVAIWGGFGWCAAFLFYLDNRFIRKSNMELHKRVSLIYKNLLEGKYRDDG